MKSEKSNSRKLVDKLFGVNDPKEAPQVPLVIEVAPLQRPLPPTPEVRSVLVSLPLNIGFDYLMKKFRFQRVILEAQLKGQKHATLEDVNTLQAYLSALAWVEAQVKLETQQQEMKKDPVTPYEQQLFNEINSQFNVVE